MAGTVIVVEPFSGDVLAMAGRPTFNPNRYSAYSASRWRNRMVSDVFEPGSIFKIVTAAAGAVTGAHPHVHIALWHGVTPALWMSIAAIAGGAPKVM